jgi:energy-coupling factor transporter ATP-binding protein EcfA2
MLKKIELENFRIFAERVSLQLRPITVLIGRNSAGKSTLIKFLLMLQQSLDASEEDFLRTDGDRTKLGDFSQLRNSRRGSGRLQFNLEYSTNDLPDRKEMALFLGSKSIKRKSDALTDELRLQLTIPAESQIPQPNSADVSVSGLVAYRSRSRIGTHQVNVVLDGEAVLREVGQLRNPEISLLRFPARSSTPEKAIQRVFSDRFLSSIRHELSSMQHLGAVREESTRVILASNPPSGTVGQRGQFALPHLREIMNEGGEKADFVQKHLGAIADVGELRFRSAGRGYVADAMATNLRTNMKSYLADFGFGVGQCLPIVVQGAIASPGALMIVEQPESQLHPSAQLELGTFFADLLNERNVMSLVETHSSQLILRLRKLVANKTLKPDDVSLAYVHVSDGTPTIKNLEILPNGNLEKGLPMEFFGADLKEAMELRAGI